MPNPMTRRRWTAIAAAAAAAACAPSQETADGLIDNPKGDYQFLKGSGPYSSAAVASPGFEVVHAIFNPVAELWSSFDLIEKHLQAAGRPVQALCGMELRIPKALSVDGFNEFNQPYIDRLKEWGVFVGDLNPIARTNVALEVAAVAEPSVFGFSYTVPSDYSSKTFVVAGAGELRSSALSADEIVSRGDVGESGLRAKADMVLQHMTERLEGMHVAWTDVTQSNIYAVHNIHPLMESTILPSLHEAARQGVRWHYARPPVLEIEYEMDIRGIRREITLG